MKDVRHCFSFAIKQCLCRVLLNKLTKAATAIVCWCILDGAAWLFFFWFFFRKLVAQAATFSLSMHFRGTGRPTSEKSPFLLSTSVARAGPEQRNSSRLLFLCQQFFKSPLYLLDFCWTFANFAVLNYDCVVLITISLGTEVCGLCRLQFHDRFLLLLPPILQLNRKGEMVAVPQQTQMPGSFALLLNKLRGILRSLLCRTLPENHRRSLIALVEREWTEWM